MEISAQRYTSDLKKEWNEFVENSKNGTFLFNREYMDYHASRFPDMSLVFRKKGNIVALFPATLKDGELKSHAGLTYGGLVTSEKTIYADVEEIFHLIGEVASTENISKIIYKPIPYIYHRIPSDEDLYALFTRRAKLFQRQISSVIDASHPLRFTQLRRRGAKKAAAMGLRIEETNRLEDFWEVLTENLRSRHNTSPVHALDEMTKLKNRFKEEIKLYGAFEEGKMTAGVLMYETPMCAHCQYISASPRGKETGALDLLFSIVIEKELSKKPYFDFGTSTENQGLYLNTSLLHQKEGFGARAVCYDGYIWEI